MAAYQSNVAYQQQLQQRLEKQEGEQSIVQQLAQQQGAPDISAILRVLSEQKNQQSLLSQQPMPGQHAVTGLEKLFATFAAPYAQQAVPPMQALQAAQPVMYQAPTMFNPTPEPAKAQGQQMDLQAILAAIAPQAQPAAAVGVPAVLSAAAAQPPGFQAQNLSALLASLSQSGAAQAPSTGAAAPQNFIPDVYEDPERKRMRDGEVEDREDSVGKRRKWANKPKQQVRPRRRQALRRHVTKAG